MTTHMESNRRRIAEVRAENIARQERKAKPKAAAAKQPEWFDYRYHNEHRIIPSSGGGAPAFIMFVARNDTEAAYVIREMLRMNGASDDVLASVRVYLADAPEWKAIEQGIYQKRQPREAE